MSHRWREKERRRWVNQYQAGREQREETRRGMSDDTDALQCTRLSLWVSCSLFLSSNKIRRVYLKIDAHHFVSSLPHSLILDFKERYNWKIRIWWKLNQSSFPFVNENIDIIRDPDQWAVEMWRKDEALLHFQWSLIYSTVSWWIRYSLRCSYKYQIIPEISQFFHTNIL